MKARTTQAMLAVVIVLLSALLMRDVLTGAAVEAQNANQTSPIVRARGFELVDERGQVRAQIYLGEDGGGSIRLRDATGAVRVKLGVSTQGDTGLLVFDEAVNPAAQIVSSKSGTFLSLAERGKEKRVIRP